METRDSGNGWAVWLLAILALALTSAAAAETATGAEPAAEARQEQQRSLHELENETLLKGFRQALDREAMALRASLRKVTEAEILFQRAREARVAIPPPDSITTQALPAPGLSEVEAERRRLAEVEARLKTLKRRQAAAQSEQTLLAEYHSGINAVVSELQGFEARAKELEAYVRQIELRVADGSLALEQAPADPRRRLADLRAELNRDKARLQAASEEAQSHSEAMSGVMAGIEEELRAAEAQLSGAQQRVAQAEKRRELADSYRGWNEGRLSQRLAEQEEERNWLNATLENSREAFVAARQAKSEMERALARPRQGEQGRQATPAASEAAADTPELAVEAASARLQRIDEALGQAQSLSDAAGVLEADASVLVEHIFPMLVIAGLLEESGGEGTVSLERLSGFDGQLSSLISDAQAAREGARTWKEALEEDRATTQAALKEAENRLEEARKVAETGRQTEAWAAELKEMAAEQVGEHFARVYAEWQEKGQQLETRREAYRTAAAKADGLREELASLKGPFEREEETQAAALENKILLDLFQTANLDIPEGMRDTAQEPQPSSAAGAAAGGADPAAAKPAAPRADQAGDQQSPQPAVREQPSAAASPSVAESIARVEAFQHLITTRLRITEERDRLEAALTQALGGLVDEIEQLLAALNDGYSLAQQRLVAAGEFKKRVGRGEIASARHPGRIIESLKRESISSLGEERARLLDIQSRLRRELDALQGAQQEGEEEKRIFSRINELAGQRLDGLRNIRQLAAAFDTELSDLAEIERKKVERAASQRMEQENTWAETLMGIFYASDSLQTLAEMLQDYYLELSELDRKQGNLQQRKTLAEGVISQYQTEKESLASLIQALESRREDALRRREEHKLLIQVRLNPDQARELLEGFEARYGYRPPMPPPLADDERAEYLRQAAKASFAREMEVRAVDRWLSLVEQRRSAQGLDRLIGGFQEMIAELESRWETLERRVELIGGGPSSEIALLRAQRIKLYRETMTIVAIKLVVILLITIVALMAVRVGKRRWIRNAEARIEEGSADDAAMLSIINLLGLVSRLAIWSVALLMTLSALGFNIGAILAGIGIGGFALAMAAKGVLGDIIGGITIMLTRLFKIGDRIQFKGGTYIVKAINIRYTILEDFSYKYKVTVPNSLLSEAETINTSAHPGYAVLTNIRLSIKNPANRILRALRIIEEVIQAHPGARFVWVKHDHFDDYSFVIRMHYDILRFAERAKVETEINAGIVERFQRESIKLTPQPGVAILRDAKTLAAKSDNENPPPS